MNIIYVNNTYSEGQNISVETQIEECKKALGGESYEIFCDNDDISCPEFTRMMDEVKRGSVSKIIVYKLKQLSSSLVHFIEIQKVLDTHHVALKSIAEKFDTDTPNGRATLSILTSLAQFETETEQFHFSDSPEANTSKLSGKTRR